MAFQTNSFQQNAFQEHVPGGAATTPTGWDLAIDSLPQSRVLSAALLASMGMAAIAFPVNNQYAPVTTSAGGPTYDRVVQYQALAFVPVVAAAGETITVDKWFVQNAEVTRALPRANVGSGVVVYPPIIPSYGWNVQQLDQQPRPPKAQPSVTVLGVPPTVSVDWLASSSGVRYPQAWRQYSASADVLYVPAVTPPTVAIDWYVQQLEAQPRARSAALYASVGTVAWGMLPPPITMDRWFVQAGEPRRNARLTALYASSDSAYVTYVAPAPTIVTMDMWFQPAQVPLRARLDAALLASMANGGNAFDPFPLPGTPPAAGPAGEENWIVPWRKRRHVIGG